MRGRSVTAVIAIVVMVATVAGCHGAPGASKACGGYHVAIENATESELAISFNGQPITTIKSRETVSIAQWGGIRVPLMPWDVEAKRASDGLPLLTIHLEDDSSDGRHVKVEDPPAKVASVDPYMC
jgi:hypothetical protein